MEETQFGHGLGTRGRAGAGTVPEALLEAIQQASNEVLGDVRPLRVFLFGSRARGTADPRSDFDLGIEAEDTIEPWKMEALRERLEEAPILQFLDVVDFSRVDETFRRATLPDSVTLYERAA